MVQHQRGRKRLETSPCTLQYLHHLVMGSRVKLLLNVLGGEAHGGVAGHLLQLVQFGQDLLLLQVLQLADLLLFPLLLLRTAKDTTEEC